MKALQLLLFFLALASASSAQTINFRKLTPYILGTTNLVSAAFGNNRFVAVGPSTIIYSEDAGTTWRYASSFPTTHFRSVSFVNGGFFATDGGRSFSRSSDGDIWTTQQFPPDTYMREIAFGEGRYLAIGSHRLASDDGNSWWRVPGTSANYVAFGNGWFLSEYIGEVSRSRDGNSWEPTQPGGPCRGLIFNGGMFYFLTSYYDGPPNYTLRGQAVIQSQDGTMWESTGIAPQIEYLTIDPQIFHQLGAVRTSVTLLAQDIGNTFGFLGNGIFRFFMWVACVDCFRR